MIRPIRVAIFKRAFCKPISPAQTAPSRPSTAEIKRFWENVTVTPSTSIPGRWNVLLDGRKLRLPDNPSSAIEFPTESLAMLTAAEWHTQELQLKPNALPITSLLSRGLDTLDMSAKDSAENREEAVDSIIKFLDTDTILYQQSYPERLVRLQNQHWLPPVNWANSRYGLGIRPTEGLMLNTSTVTDNDRQKLRHEVLKFDGMKLAGFERAVIASKSFLIGLALVEGKLGVEQAVEAARVELMAQTAVWGNVEDVHDLELQFTRRQLSSSMLFLLDGRESDEGQ